MDYLSSLAPPTVGNNTAENLRIASDYIRSNTKLYYDTFRSTVVRDWNELPHTRKFNAPNIRAFKRSPISTLIGVPFFHLDGKRIGQMYHARLRIDCSSLNHHLFSKTSLTVRYAFVVEQKLPNTTCLNTCARK